MIGRRSATFSLLVVLGSVVRADAREAQTLLEAVKASDTAAVRTLLKSGADVNAAAVDGTTPLHWAVRRDAVEVADLLIRAGAHPDRPNRYGVTPIALAAANGSGEMITRLLDAGASAKAVSADGETLLMTAARSGTAAGVKALLAGGASVGARENRRGTTALMWAAEAKQAGVASLLIEAGANVADRSRGDYSALLIAVRAGSLETVQVLLTAGADINDSAPAGDPNEQITIGFASKRPPAFGPNDTGAVRTSALVLAMLNGHFTLATWIHEMGRGDSVARRRSARCQHGRAVPGGPGCQARCSNDAGVDSLHGRQSRVRVERRTQLAGHRGVHSPARRRARHSH
jgi:ankyrin repeat protein